MRLVIARAVMPNCSEDTPVCGRSKFVIDSVVLSAALHDVESRGASSAGCLLWTQLGAALSEISGLTLWLLPSL